jgi:hypothetical protein
MLDPRRAQILALLCAAIGAGGLHAPPAAAQTSPGAAAGTGADAGDGAARAQVTLPLKEYQRLKALDERPGVTVIDNLRLGGSFKARDLWIALTGRSSGRMPPVGVLLAPSGVRVYGCEGEAIVGRDGGEFTLTPLSGRFRVGCRLALSGSDRLQLTATAAVLYVDAQVSDGELVGTDSEDGRRSFSVVRMTGGPAEVVRPTATARYRLSLHPEETRFRYQLDMRNPNRSHQPFVVKLRSGEHVQQVDAPVAYELEAGGGYRFQLPPGETTLALSGTLAGTQFTPPVEASVQYLLLQSHPLLRPQVQRAARRISAAETGLVAQFRGAQGFLLAPGESFSFSVIRLEALRTTSFAVREARHVFFLSADSKALGETTLSLDNQGAPDLTLPMRAEPTYASLQGERTFLTKNEAGHLWLPLSQGAQEVVVQHRQQLPTRAGLAAATLYLPQLAAPASTAHVELRYPREWVPLYAEFWPDSKILFMDGWDLVGLLLLLLWTERALSLLGLARPRRLLLAASLLGAGAASGAALVLLVLADVVVSAVGILPWLRRLLARGGALRILLILTALGIGGVLLIALGSMTVMRAAAPRPSAELNYLQSADRMAKMQLKADEKPADGKDAEADQDKAGQSAYQGLPAKFEMPAGADRTHFYREMLATESPRAVRALLLSSRAASAIALFFLLIGAGMLLLHGRGLRAGLRGLWQQALPPPTPPPIPAAPAAQRGAPPA